MWRRSARSTTLGILLHTVSDAGGLRFQAVCRDIP